MTEKLTVLVPTYNRHRSIRRLLTFLRLMGNRFEVRVLDGSQPAIQEKNRNWIEKNKSAFGFQVKWNGFPGDLQMGKRLAAGLAQVTTPYVLFCADDDFYVPSGIEQCLGFMEDHPEYSIATGYSPCLFHCEVTRFFKKGIAVFDRIPLVYDLNQETFFQRYTATQCYGDHAPPIFYGVRRTVHSQKIYNLISPSIMMNTLEYLNNSLSLMWGKAKVLPTVTNLRDYGTPSICESDRQDPTYLLSEPDVRWLNEVLSMELEKTESLSKEEAHKIVARLWPLPLKPFEPTILRATPITRLID